MTIFQKAIRHGFPLTLIKMIQGVFRIPFNVCYSELCEDLILMRAFNKDNGFYVDIGAFDPDRISVTKSFYISGWHGINIDPNPSAIQRFNRKRKGDINLNVGVSDKESEMDFYFFGDDIPQNTFDKTHCEAEMRRKGIPLKKIMKIKCLPINDILARYLPPGQHIDFINLDVENFELRILKSFDFEKYAPDYFVVEDLSFRDQNKDLMEFRDSELYALMLAQGYVVAAKTHFTVIFRRKSPA